MHRLLHAKRPIDVHTIDSVGGQHVRLESRLQAVLGGSRPPAGGTPTLLHFFRETLLVLVGIVRDEAGAGLRIRLWHARLDTRQVLGQFFLQCRGLLWIRAREVRLLAKIAGRS